MQWLHTFNTADREGDWRKETFFETPTEAHLFFVKHDTAANRMRKKSDAASWVSAHTMSSSRPCRLGRCFPGPPTLDHRSRTGCTAAPRRRCITRSRSSRCIHGGETLGLLLSGSAPCLLSMTHRGHHVTAANFWAGRLEEGGVLLIIPMYFPCIRSRTFKGRCDHGLNKYSRASTPSKVREACTVLVLPTTRQTGAQGAQRRGERCWKIGREGGRSQRQVGQKRKEDSFRLCRAKSLGQRRSRRGQERWAGGCEEKKLVRRCRR